MALATAPSVRRRSPRPPALLVIAGAVVALLTLLPLGFVAFEAVQTGWAEGSRLVFRDRTADLLWNTTRLTAGCVALCVLLGTAAAWLVERSGRTASALRTGPTSTASAILRKWRIRPAHPPASVWRG